MIRKLLIVSASGLALSVLLLSGAWVVGGQELVDHFEKDGGWNIQIDTELISEFRAAGVEPLKTVTATRRGHLVELDSGDGLTVELDGDHAHAVQVEILP